ncbi:class I SAM-dependent methyltransferase [Flindersiella endophytica]
MSDATTPIPTLSPLENSLWLTLCGRALDARRADAILGDRMADRIVREVGYDYAKLNISGPGAINIAHRAKKLDEIAQAFIAQHPDAVGLDLGAGLDSRILRLDVPPAVEWYDIDFPGVIAAREHLLPHHERAHSLAADLTTGDWLDEIPSDRPAVIVADGLIAFLSDEEMRTLVNRLVDHFPGGQIAFNGYSKFAVWAQRHYKGAESIAGLTKFDGFDDPHVPESWNPRIELVREILLTREPEVEHFPTALRLFTKLGAHSEGMSRRGNVVLHYRF